ncbi:VIT domain-containing protein [Oleomonas cavernae]|uniref:VIT domain-containing protein n=1 Tax=Oleomonas cavernae TaxID=2320859 RepID=UPI0018F2BC2D|nr:VIT domain-containing protein [Oleomonas cavernae]
MVSTRFDVDIDGGLATVVTSRVFRNDEAQSIEATITFPVPVHAVLFDLEALIDGRLLKARAQRRSAAREAYEDAIERGKAAVLHEEVLRGVHMLSVAHVAPGAEITVKATWAITLRFVGDSARLRIPLTVGDIYGRSRLPDSDDLLAGGPLQHADISVRSSSGTVSLAGGSLAEGQARVPLNAPIDLAVTGMMLGMLRGRAADGREVALRITPCGPGEALLNVAVLVDRSGSMGGGKHHAVVRGLTAVADMLGEADLIDLWQFDNELEHVGAGQPLRDLVARLGEPRGGTEIGGALSGAMAGSRMRDILLLTDGLSHALDVQALARRGRRITVLLIGHDSLEANVGHLAALTGGDIFVASPDDIAAVLAAAIGSLRLAAEPVQVGDAEHIRAVRGNALLEADWLAATGAGPQGRAVAAVAAGLALPALDEERAAALAQAEGLVTHLTSLVLVDEAGAVQETLPATRKIALAAPAAPAPMARMVRAKSPSAASYSSAPPDMLREEVRSLSAPLDLSSAAGMIDWDRSPGQLVAGDVSGLGREIALLIGVAAVRPDVTHLATQLKLDPVMLVVALIARSLGEGNRSAARIAKAVLGSGITEELRRLAAALGLEPAGPRGLRGRLGGWLGR